MRLLVKILAGLLVALLAAAAGLYIALQTDRYDAQPPDDRTYALVDVRLVDGTDAAPIDDAAVVVDGNRIAAAGPADDVDTTGVDDVYELGGHTVIPGLFDAHVHLSFPHLDEDQRPQDVGLTTILWGLARQAPGARRGLIDHGVTSVKSAGEPDDWAIEVRDDIRDDELEGPRIFTAGPIITAPGGHPADTVLRGRDFVVDSATRQVDGPDQARRAVADVDDLGVDVVKIVVDRGPDHAPWPTLEADSVEAVVDEAHDRDLRVFAHWRWADEFEVGLRAGVAGFEHPGDEPLSDEQIDRLVADDVAFTPTLAAYEAFYGEVPEPARHNAAAVAEAGGRLVAGSDAAIGGLRFGTSLQRELELLVDAGVDSHRALQAATAEAAAHIGVDDRLGTIEAGKLADLVVLADDPTDNISAIRSVEMVVRDGRVLVDRR